MRKKLFGVPVGELKTVRITCKQKLGDRTCDGIVELRLSVLSEVTRYEIPCPLCQNSLRQPGLKQVSDDALFGLAEALGKVQNMAARYDLEFVIPDDDAETK